MAAIIFKKNRSKAAKITGAVLFVLLMFFNFQFLINSNKGGDINLLGLRFSLVPSTYARTPTVKGPQEFMLCPDGSWVYQCWNQSGLCGINDACL